MIFADIIKELPEQPKLQNAAYPLHITGLSNIHKAHLLTFFAENASSPSLVLTPDEPTARQICEDFRQLSGETRSSVLVSREWNFQTGAISSHEFEYERIQLLCGILAGEIKWIFCPVEAAVQYTIPKEALQKRMLFLSSGETVPLPRLLETLQKAGYNRRTQVDGPAQFAVRGGIIDIYATSCANPVRLEFFGDEIAQMALFDLDTQRRTETISSVFIAPASEGILPQDLQKKLQAKGMEKSSAVKRDMEALKSGLPLPGADRYFPFCYDTPGSIFDYIHPGRCFISEWQAVKEAAKESFQRFETEQEPFFKGKDTALSPDCYQMNGRKLKKYIAPSSLCILDTFSQKNSDFKIAESIHIEAAQAPYWNGTLPSLSQEIAKYREKDTTIVILTGTQKAARNLAQDLRDKGFDASAVSPNHSLQKGKIYLLEGCVSSGFFYPGAKAVLFTHAGMKGQKKKRKKWRKGEEIRSLSDLKPGDYVVHIIHGVGIYKGIAPLTVQGVLKDYIKIQYDGNDMLYLPVTQLSSIAKYIGPGQNENIKLNKMGSSEWKNTKQRVKKETEDLAREMLDLYAKREQAKGFAFSADNDWQISFEEHFEYEETGDQLRSIAQIKQDMQRARPMDRLLCGDVGFGKTEVALRAAFKCILDSKQCALLCPTTLLAWQHFQTTLRRIGEFPIKVELLTRFRTAKQQREILKELKSGAIDLIIGTHRLVQNDVEYKDLGLAIIDEEQRFGVKQKERFKELFYGVDVLSLSATPIPRTLNMTLSGLRDISLLEEPPQDRYPVQTYVIEYNTEILYAAIAKELGRNGQVFYLHNRVDTIERTADTLQAAFPQAKVGVAHGKMQENQLNQVWTQLIEQQIDILVCTTIIETGIDLPNCNTLIIEDAEKMGLAQLYQLRGRVGRSSRRAFAYFTFYPQKALSETASKRLEAIREFTEFGSGFRIALRDLEIRGAGSLLGSRQHGQMLAVGYDMYMQLLGESVRELKGEDKEPKSEDCLIDIPIQAHIPKSYMESEMHRLDFYRKIAALQSKEQQKDLCSELTDRFGEPPASVLGLMEIALMRFRAGKLGILEITQKPGKLCFRFPQWNAERIAHLSEVFQDRLTIYPYQYTDLELKMEEEPPVSLLDRFLSVAEEA